MEPATVLIRSLEVEVGGKAGIERPRPGAGAPPVGTAHHGLMGGA